MRRGRANKPARRGFTLVELLVVIAIITILMSLLLAAVMRSVIKTEEVKSRNDISQLSQAIESFKTKFHVEQPPSRLVLANSKAGYFKADGVTPIDAVHGDSWNYLNRVWPRLNWASGINWGGTNGQNLEGEQCLVFFLGGIPSGGACTGFSTNPANPTAAGGDRITFYDFPVNRLTAGPGGYLVYLDPYKKMPYAYFSAYKTANGYNRYATAPFTAAKGDCPSLNVAPYAEGWNGSATAGAPVNYLNPNSYQIISAGRDKTFGSGTVSPSTTWTFKAPGSFASPPGSDDMANFHDRFLGIPAN